MMIENKFKENSITNKLIYYTIIQIEPGILQFKFKI